MSQFTDKRTTKDITLPSYPEDKITLYSSLLAGDYGEVMEETIEFKRTIKMLIYLIKSWTFEDNGKIMEVNEDNLKKFPTPDFVALVEAMTAVIEENTEKKMKK